jgi:8-oxo-dGTP pyrophosphatase MutT (NUDIX family)
MEYRSFNSFRKFKRGIVCLNCDRQGHTFKKCNMPIKSFGIIPFKRKNNIVRFLLIQRKDTMGYTDFMRGKYKYPNGSINYDRLKILVEEMTSEEKNKILNFSFDELWAELWLDHNAGIFIKEKQYAARSYSSIDIVPIVKASLPSKYQDNEWGFPKGRKNLNETGLECAIREFKEETGLFDDDFRIIPHFNPVAENFIGSDGIKYTHIYYLAEIKNDIDLRYRSKDKNLLQEVKNIGFFEYKQAYKLFRDYDVQKRYTLTKVKDYISKMR